MINLYLVYCIYKLDIMKKLLLLLIGLTVISCGGSDDDDVTIDPVVGTWLSSNSDGSSIDTANDGRDIISYLVVFNSNGTMAATTEYSPSPNGVSNGTWENLGSDLTSISQTYLLTYDGKQEQGTFTFTEDFNEYRVSSLTYTKQ